MTRSARVVGAALIIAGALTVAGVAANFALVNRAGTHATCVDRAMPTSGTRLTDAGEGTAVHPAFSLAPVGLSCRFDRADGGVTTTFLDLGTLPTALGGGLVIAGVAVLVTRSRRERLLGTDVSAGSHRS